MTSSVESGKSDIPVSEIATYRRLFGEKYAELEELLEGLPDAALLWKPFEQSPWKGGCYSIGEAVAHAISSTVYLLRRAEYVMGRLAWDQVDGDEGSQEFGPANHALPYLQARVRRTHDFVNQFLDSVSSSDLDAARAHPERPRTLSARYDVQHALEHLSQHIGHAQITRQWWALDHAGHS
ncbi:MAG TPA: DinB family protein [Caldilineaceae bacterium]|nr:DinB family protein [Caldilineaceae bacterium]